MTLTAVIKLYSNNNINAILNTMSQEYIDLVNDIVDYQTQQIKWQNLSTANVIASLPSAITASSGIPNHSVLVLEISCFVYNFFPTVHSSHLNLYYTSFATKCQMILRFIYYFFKFATKYRMI